MKNILTLSAALFVFNGLFAADAVASSAEISHATYLTAENKNQSNLNNLAADHKGKKPKRQHHAKNHNHRQNKKQPKNKGNVRHAAKKPCVSCGGSGF